ncbi:hypothetical protein E2P81_ATG02535 [Venturia nashicola]|uniref:Uncharacterized protein n=1 Tax=Venturia nashicola TaxID=86259 RepID=A0A4Z1PNK6_9PEZI|nr:hypothetical protein E6O75_ATG02597 [Venturia nashicola]TLD36753.1 hypothetical protein E2P81_ATG02535 [Venturia nashicola]
MATVLGSAGTPPPTTTPGVFVAVRAARAELRTVKALVVPGFVGTGSVGVAVVTGVTVATGTTTVISVVDDGTLPDGPATPGADSVTVTVATIDGWPVQIGRVKLVMKPDTVSKNDGQGKKKKLTIQRDGNNLGFQQATSPPASPSIARLLWMVQHARPEREARTDGTRILHMVSSQQVLFIDVACLPRVDVTSERRLPRLDTGINKNWHCRNFS